MNPYDLTLHPPRSARVRLGGFNILPRMLDKGRATIAGTNGEYHYACPLDQRFLTFMGVDPDALKTQLTEGKGDGEILAWILENAKNHPTEFAVDAWSKFNEARVPTDLESRAFFNDIHKGAGANREDIATWFDVLDLDDYASFGGKA
ncbi:MAG TPA: DUF5069 domain-containing protein [Chthoniobacteraceae bacterium]|nr:DUF5069 domain-containing protein [Chthoniobacteraceae bacterium]